MGPRRNMNGAGAGGRLVARRGGEAGTTQLGNRDQRRYDLRVAFGVRGAKWFKWLAYEQVCPYNADNTQCS